MGRPERQSELATRYRFDCTCEACSQSGEILDSSEARRRRIAQLSKVIFDAPPPRQTALAEELCALTEAEGLPVVWQRLAIIAAMKAAKELGTEVDGNLEFDFFVCTSEACDNRTLVVSGCRRAFFLSF